MIIAVGTTASGLDIYTRFQGVLTDPQSISYCIKAPQGGGYTSVASGTGYKRSVGHYDARNSTIPSGYDIDTSWQITWTITSPVGVTSTATEEFQVVDALSPSFSNVDNLVDQIKLNLGLADDDYTQAEYEMFVEKALNRINRRLRLIGTDNEMSFNTNTGLIDPDPDAAVYDLILMQIECMIVKRGRRIAIGKGIRVKDGETEIDTTAGFRGYNDLVNDICGELDDAIEDYLANGAGDGGAYQYAENVWYGNRKIYADMDHDGEGSGRTRNVGSPYEEMGLQFPMDR